MTEPTIYYEVHGQKGPFLLMLHGILSSRAQWIPNLKELKEFCRPVIVELFGHGRSPAPDTPEIYSPDNYVREFECIRRNLGANCHKTMIAGFIGGVHSSVLIIGGCFKSAPILIISSSA